MVKPQSNKIAIPLAALGVIVTVLIWLSGRAITQEHRTSVVEVRCKNVEDNIVEIKDDIKEIMRDIRKLVTHNKMVDEESR